MDEQLRRRSVGAPAARSLLLTVLGEYVLPRADGRLAGDAGLALTSVGYTHHAARQALARSTRDGWLSRRAPRAPRPPVADRRHRRPAAHRGGADLLVRPAVAVGRALAGGRPARPRGAPSGSPSAALTAGLDRPGVAARRRVADPARRARGRAGRGDQRRAGRRGPVVRGLAGRHRRPRAARSPRRGTSSGCDPSTTPSSRTSRACDRRRPRRAFDSRRCSCTPGASSRSWIPICPPQLLPARWPPGPRSRAVRRPPPALGDAGAGLFSPTRGRARCHRRRGLTGRGPRFGRAVSGEPPTGPCARTAPAAAPPAGRDRTLGTGRRC